MPAFFNMHDVGRAQFNYFEHLHDSMLIFCTFNSDSFFQVLAPGVVLFLSPSSFGVAIKKKTRYFIIKYLKSPQVLFLSIYDTKRNTIYNNKKCE